MSVATWKEEYFPEADLSKVAPRDAAKHSALKWQGCLPENLTAHGVVRHGRLIIPADHVGGGDAYEYVPADQIVWLNGETCALCHHFYDVDNESAPCHKCPLVKIGFAPCENDDSVYEAAVSSNHRYSNYGIPLMVMALLWADLHGYIDHDSNCDAETKAE